MLDRIRRLNGIYHVHGMHVLYVYVAICPLPEDYFIPCLQTFLCNISYAELDWLLENSNEVG